MDIYLNESRTVSYLDVTCSQRKATNSVSFDKIGKIFIAQYGYIFKR